MTDVEWNDENLTLLAESVYDLLNERGWPGREGFPYLDEMQFQIVTDKVTALTNRDKMAAGELPLNPLITFGLELTGTYQSLNLTFHDDDTREVIFEMRYDDPLQLEGVAQAFAKASKALVRMSQIGYAAAVAESDELEHEPVVPDMSGDLFVEDILAAAEGDV